MQGRLTMNKTKEDFEWAVKLNRASLNLLGVWPSVEKNPGEKIVSNIRAFFTFLVVMTLLVPSMHSLMKIHSNIMLTIENLQYTLAILSTIIRLLIIWWKKKALASVVNMIVEDWLQPKSIHERNTMIKWALRARIIITCSYLIIMIGLIFIFGMPIFGKSLRFVSNITDSDKLLAIQTYYIYDVTKRPQYELTFISQCISLFTVSMVYTGIDNFLGLLVFHICGQMDIMRNRLKYGHKDFHAQLRNNVIFHIRLLRAINIIEDTYNGILLILFLYFGIIFAFCGFLLVTLFKDEENDISVMRLSYLFIIIMSLFLHMAIYCVFGEALISEYSEIHYAVYDCEWFSLKPKEVKDLIPFLIKVSKPVYLTAGKMFPITMATFSNLIKTSASYVSVLLTTRKN